ncbi:MAG: hypothetical protein HS126_25010 [Anaerolineales bacterium]|nr:hypothetical protein [Anaerolineales bacterium]
MPAIEALGVEVFVTWRRMESPPPPSQLIRFKETIPVYQISCSDDFEGYWRQSGHWNTVNKCRKRCKDFTFAVNAPGAAEWIIRNWGPTWERKPVVVNDSILVAKYLENQGRCYSLVLLDQDKLVAGHTFFTHRNDIVWVHTYRDPAYDAQGCWHTPNGPGLSLGSRSWLWDNRLGWTP